jgi:hypothetical protein
VGVRPILIAGKLPAATERMLLGNPETPNASSSLTTQALEFAEQAVRIVQQ